MSTGGNAIALKLAGRLFSEIASKPSPPRGDYVAYGEGFFPVTPKTGYPLSVLAAIAAGKSGNIVLIPTTDSVIFVLSGSNRTIQSQRNIEGSQEGSAIFYRTLLRLTLLSDHHEIVSLGDIPELANTPVRKVDLDNLSLPPVIKRRRTWQMIGIFCAMSILGLIAGAFVRSVATANIVSATVSREAAEVEMSGLLSTVREGRGLLKAAADGGGASVNGASLVLPLPDVNESFTDKFYATAAQAKINAIKINNGQIQF